MKNPPRKPRAPKGYALKWRRPYSYKRVVGRRRTLAGRYEKIFKLIRVPGHYVPVKRQPSRPLSRGPRRVSRLLSGWTTARAFESDMRREYDVHQADPIYRLNRETDVVRLSDGLVWSHPIKSDPQGSFSVGRIWYVVHHETQDEYYIYVRTFRLDLTLSNLSQAAEERLRWEGAVLGEYDGKEYMEVERFIAWTVFDDRDRGPRRLHGRTFKGLTREKQLTTDKRRPLDERHKRVLKTRAGQRRTVEYETRRVLSQWEIKQVLNTARGATTGLRTRKGESWEAAYKRLSRPEKSRYRRKLMDAVRRLEHLWEEKRRNK